MLKGEMKLHLDYESKGKGEIGTEYRRNGYGRKSINTNSGEVEIKLSRNRDDSFNPERVSPK